MTEVEQRRVIAALASSAQHDVNNLLTVLLATLELMRNDLPEGDKAARRIDRMELASQRLRDLLRAFFTLARDGDGQCDGAALLHRLAPVLRLAMRPAPSLSIDAPLEGVQIEADSAALAARLVEALRGAQNAVLRLLPDRVALELDGKPAQTITFPPAFRANE
ncbi:MAG: sensor histidine kinase [Rhodospirillales bacterium]|nr:sensor histidine kinase [Rhodospirillales bacterium]